MDGYVQMMDIGTMFVRAGQLGHGVNIKIVLAPLRLTDFLGLRVKMVSCGGVHSACVIEEGGAWTWGTGRTGASQSTFTHHTMQALQTCTHRHDRACTLT